ncbi:hypothetical protein C9374_006058 [Naegleria lovaniensis]|uniref:Uncharacterized protein n=1 Tax=Naegleria lovaniensis TaxID=51637 RepID=A0AA88GIM8_NAELO|nr:uncharacterized protein C9374_006058 [Naegleria lovaniensis]KAG2381674.1 hypothetical protein C9374_006058 [Naegleria lovaniensis]
MDHAARILQDFTSQRLRLEQLLPKFVVDCFINGLENYLSSGNWNESEQALILEKLNSFVSFLHDERIAKYQIRNLSEYYKISDKDTLWHPSSHQLDTSSDENTFTLLPLSDELERFVCAHEFVEKFKGKQKKKQPTIQATQHSTQTSNDSIFNTDEYYPLYMPKFNTFFKHKNENLHIEKGDEGFECFSSQDQDLYFRVHGAVEGDRLDQQQQQQLIAERNIARSKAMISSFHLRIQEDVKPFIQSLLTSGPLQKFLNEKSFRTSVYEATFGHIQTEEEAMDFYRQLCGEDEQLTVTMDMAIYELKRVLAMKAKKPKKLTSSLVINIPFTFEFKQAYLMFLKMLDYEIVSSARSANYEPIEPNEIPTRVRQTKYPTRMTSLLTTSTHVLENSISWECVGHLAKFYFIPWLDYENTQTPYTSRIDTRNLIFPWILFNARIQHEHSALSFVPRSLLYNIVQSHLHMYQSCGYDNDIMNRIRGISVMNDTNSMDQLYSNFSAMLTKSSSQREIQFYEKEKRKLLPEKPDTDVEDLLDLLHAYKTKLENRARLSQYTALISNMNNHE